MDQKEHLGEDAFRDSISAEELENLEEKDSSEEQISKAPDLDGQELLNSDTAGKTDELVAVIEKETAENNSVGNETVVGQEHSLKSVHFEPTLDKDDGGVQNNLNTNEEKALDFSFDSQFGNAAAVDAKLDTSALACLASVAELLSGADHEAWYILSKEILLASIMDPSVSSTLEVCDHEGLSSQVSSCQEETSCISASQASTDAQSTSSQDRQEEIWTHSGVMRNTSGMKYRVKIRDEFPTVRRSGKIVWDDGTSGDVLVEPLTDLSSQSSSNPGDSMVSFGDSDWDQISSVDSPPSLAEQAVGLVLINQPGSGKSASISVYTDPSVEGPIISIPDKFANSRRVGIPVAFKRVTVGRSRTVAPTVERNGPTRILRTTVKRAELQSKGKRTRTQNRLNSRPNVLKSEMKMVARPSVEKDITSVSVMSAVVGENEEPAICRRCNLKPAGREHFDRTHNGLLMAEQDRFEIEEKRVRWNMVMKKKLKLRCQIPTCGKVMNSTTAMQYHELTCGVDVVKEECPECHHQIASSYLRQHILSHNRQAGQYTRPRRKTGHSESDDRLSTASGGSKRKSEEIDEGIVVDNKRPTRGVGGD